MTKPLGKSKAQVWHEMITEEDLAFSKDISESKVKIRHNPHVWRRDFGLSIPSNLLSPNKKEGE